MGYIRREARERRRGAQAAHAGLQGLVVLRVDRRKISKCISTKRKKKSNAFRFLNKEYPALGTLQDSRDQH
jgi:hypothetical protein